MTPVAWFFLIGGIAWFLIGIVVATICILIEGEPSKGDEGLILFLVAIWPIVVAVEGPIVLARWIKGRKGKPQGEPDL